jgi:hypothetical protein
VVELRLLDRKQEHGPLSELERQRAFLFEPAVPIQRLAEELADPRRGLREEEPAVPPGRAGPDPAPVDDEDALSALRDEARRRTAGNSGPYDDGVGRV